MLMFFKKIRKNRKGYTLTELIVVVAILGILAAVATPMVINQINNARTNTDQANATTISNAYKVFLAGGGAAATTSAEAVTAIHGALPTIPDPEVAANEFYLNLTTGLVESRDADPDAAANVWVLVSTDE